jgi:hypothetical protein
MLEPKIIEYVIEQTDAHLHKHPNEFPIVELIREFGVKKPKS